MDIMVGGLVEVPCTAEEEDEKSTIMVYQVTGRIEPCRKSLGRRNCELLTTSVAYL